MKRFLHWLESPGVNILAVIALIGVIGTTVIGSIEPNPLGFDIEPDSRPVYYDLCLAYLAGWIFHLLVVLLPERRKRESLMGSLRGSLMTIANNGADLLSDLETIAGCPEVRPLTEEHVEKVVTATNNNEAVRSLIAIRLKHAEKAYTQLIPYMNVLPLELQIALQLENQDFLHLFYNSTESTEKEKQRAPSMYDLTKEDIVMVNAEAVRQHLGGQSRMFWGYYKSTQAVHEEVNRYPFSDMKSASGIPFTQRYVFFWGLEVNEEITEYPPTATSNKPLASFN